MEDFGEARFILSSKLTMTLLLCESEAMPDYFYTFTKKKSKILTDGTESSYYECLECRRLGEKIRGRVIVNNGRVKTDPDANHNPFCRPITKGQAESLQVVREMMIPNAESGKKVRVAYNEACEEMERRGVTRSEIPAYKSVSSTLYRRALAANPRTRPRVRSAHMKRPICRNSGYCFGLGDPDPNFSLADPNIAVENEHTPAEIDSPADRSVAATATVETTPTHPRPRAPASINSYLANQLGVPHQQVTGPASGIPAQSMGAVLQELRQINQAMNKMKLPEEFAKAILVKMREIKVLYQAADQLNRSLLGEEYDSIQSPTTPQLLHPQNSATNTNVKKPRVVKRRKIQEDVQPLPVETDHDGISAIRGSQNSSQNDLATSQEHRNEANQAVQNMQTYEMTAYDEEFYEEQVAN